MKQDELNWDTQLWQQTRCSEELAKRLGDADGIYDAILAGPSAEERPVLLALLGLVGTRVGHSERWRDAAWRSAFALCQTRRELTGLLAPALMGMQYRSEVVRLVSQHPQCDASVMLELVQAFGRGLAPTAEFEALYWATRHPMALASWLLRLGRAHRMELPATWPLYRRLSALTEGHRELIARCLPGHEDTYEALERTCALALREPPTA